MYAVCGSNLERYVEPLRVVKRRVRKQRLTCYIDTRNIQSPLEHSEPFLQDTSLDVHGIEVNELYDGLDEIQALSDEYSDISVSLTQVSVPGVMLVPELEPVPVAEVPEPDPPVPEPDLDWSPPRASSIKKKKKGKKGVRPISPPPPPEVAPFHYE